MAVESSWQCVWDPGKQQHFYWNAATLQSQWEPPGTTDALTPMAEGKSVPRGEQPPTLPEGWQAVWESSANAYFYWNAGSNATQWEVPLCNAESLLQSGSAVHLDTTTCENAEPPLLTSFPEGWQAVWQASAGRHFYWHAGSGATQWEAPGGALPHGWQAIWQREEGKYFYWHPVSGATQREVPGGELPSGWQACWEPSVQKYFYWNATQNLTQWEVPTACAAAVQQTSYNNVVPISSEHRLSGFRTHMLQIGSEPFDPSQPPLCTQLLSLLGAPDSWTISRLGGFQGGLNEGVWVVDSAPASTAANSDQAFILKLVRGTRKLETLPTEAENLTRIFAKYPDIIADPTLAFPILIFGCQRISGDKPYDLIAMRRSKGARLAEVIALKWPAGHRDQLARIFEAVGRCAAEFHMRYNDDQHCDLQPSNIFWDETDEKVTFIDIGGMGTTTTDNDIQHFSKSLQILGKAYGEDFETFGCTSFLAGYSSVGAEMRMPE